jgi:hypothetical protein
VKVRTEGTVSFADSVSGQELSISLEPVRQRTSTVEGLFFHSQAQLSHGLCCPEDSVQQRQSPVFYGIPGTLLETRGAGSWSRKRSREHGQPHFPTHAGCSPGESRDMGYGISQGLFCASRQAKGSFRMDERSLLDDPVRM